MKKILTNVIRTVISERMFLIYLFMNIIYVILLTIYNNILLSKFSIEDWYSIITYNVFLNTLFLIFALVFTIIGAVFIGICFKNIYNIFLLEETDCISFIISYFVMIVLSIIMILLTITSIYIPLLRAILFGGAFIMALLSCTNN